MMAILIKARLRSKVPVPPFTKHKMLRRNLLIILLLLLCSCSSSTNALRVSGFKLSVPQDLSFRPVEPVPYEEDVKEWTTDYAVLLCEENGIGIALYELSTEDPGSSAYQMTKEDALTGVEQSFSLSGHRVGRPCLLL